MSNSSKKKIVTITRSRWARGKKNRPRESCFSQLLHNSLYNEGLNTMCCLGFVCRAKGAKVKNIRGVALPDAAKDWQSPDWLDDIADQAATVNDRYGITDREREKQLRELFADTPIRLKFVP